MLVSSPASLFLSAALVASSPFTGFGGSRVRGRLGLRVRVIMVISVIRDMRVIKA